MAAAVALTAGVLATTPARGQQPSLLTLSVGFYGFNREQYTAAELGIQYRPDVGLGFLRPMVGGMVTTDLSSNVYAGIGLDLALFRWLVLRPSFAPGLFVRGRSLDLGHLIEFRSAAELAFRFRDGSRLALEVYHLSNARLGHTNPGQESVLLTYSVPLLDLPGL